MKCKHVYAVILITLCALMLHAAAGNPPAAANSTTAARAQNPTPGAPQAGHSGKLTFLRVHDVGTGYGNPNMDVEVVIKLDSDANNAYGFQLRDDANKLARQGMLDLLRDAFNNNWTVTINENSGVIFRVWLTKP